MRFLIASLLVPASDALVRQTYQQTLGVPCPVRTLHTTFIPPFVIANPSVISLPPLTALNYTTGQPDLFIRHRRILYYPLSPATPLIAYFDALLPSLRPSITFESPDFPPDQIPDFLPHITLDYDFTLPSNWSLPSINLTLTPPQLLIESGPGIWIPHVV